MTKIAPHAFDVVPAAAYQIFKGTNVNAYSSTPVAVTAFRMAATHRKLSSSVPVEMRTAYGSPNAASGRTITL